jgi:hypothetical protein
MICHKHKAIFIHIPKTAGTSIANALGEEQCHVSAREAKEQYRDYWKSYFKFTFCRNPWDRLVSLFYYYQRGNNRENKHIKKILSRLSFRDFILDLENQTWCHGILTPYFDTLVDDTGLLVDYIGDFETFSRDMSIVAKLLDIDNLVLPHARASKRKLKHYRDYYQDDTKEIVGQFCEKDIRFGQYTY